jgi:hypothetical protein
MSDTLRVYLCGSIKKGDDDKRSSFWSEEDVSELARATRPRQLIVLNPGDRQDDLSDVRATFGRDLLQVFTADAIIVDARDKRGVGVGAEMLFARTHRIPVVTVAPRNSHYHRTDVTIMGQFVAEWLHPFISELSDTVVESVYAAGIAAASFDNDSAHGPEKLREAMLHYLNTQSQREPEMISLLTQTDGLPERASDIVNAAHALRRR